MGMLVLHFEGSVGRIFRSFSSNSTVLANAVTFAAGDGPFAGEQPQ